MNKTYTLPIKAQKIIIITALLSFAIGSIPTICYCIYFFETLGINLIYFSDILGVIFLPLSLFLLSYLLSKDNKKSTTTKAFEASLWAASGFYTHIILRNVYFMILPSDSSFITNGFYSSLLPFSAIIIAYLILLLMNRFETKRKPINTSLFSFQKSILALLIIIPIFFTYLSLSGLLGTNANVAQPTIFIMVYFVALFTLGYILLGKHINEISKLYVILTGLLFAMTLSYAIINCSVFTAGPINGSTDVFEMYSTILSTTFSAIGFYLYINVAKKISSSRK